MKTKEEKKVIRAFELFIVWVLFFAATVSGLLFAGARTDAVHTGREAETVKVIRNKNHREQTTACGDWL